jgi:anhydro-N-acetylmuramic acid kinase
VPPPWSTERRAQGSSKLTEAHAETVEHLFKEHRINRTEIAIAGFHGQTVLHRPVAGLTLQIGDGTIPVAYDFRAADMAADGQDAPPVPIYHKALAATPDWPQLVAVLNIGGVANTVAASDGSGLVRSADRATP